MGMALLGAFLVSGTLEPGAIVDQQTHIVGLGNSARAGASSRSRSASSCSSPRRSPRPSARRSTSPRASPRSSATSSSTRACASACSSSPSSSRSSSSSAIMITLFFGGWHWGASHRRLPAGHAPAERRCSCCVMFALLDASRSFAFCSFQLLIRWSLPRFRSDQLMRLGWQRLLPISIANVVATALVILWVAEPEIEGEASHGRRSQSRQPPRKLRRSRRTCRRSPRGWASRSATS